MLKEFCIDIPKLKLGIHHQDFQVGTSLFEEHPDISDANILAHLQIERTSMHLDIHYQLSGTIELLCDRCLLPYPFFIHAEHQVVYSFDQDMQETDDAEVVYIPRSIHLLDVSQDIYDFISLQIPLRHVPEDCPKETCPTDVLKFLLPENVTNIEPLKEDGEIDPRWEVLKKLSQDMNQHDKG